MVYRPPSSSKEEIAMSVSADDKLVVRFKDGVTKERARRLAAKFGPLHLTVPDLNIYVLYLDEGVFLEKTLKSLNALEDVEYAERPAPRRPMQPLKKK